MSSQILLISAWFEEMGMSNMDKVVTTGIYVNGESRPASGGAVYDIHNPAWPGELVGHAATAKEKDVDDRILAFGEPHSISGPAGFLLG
ncbi:MAG: hypothetical protein ACR2O0_09575 [Rhizobiaceae bacterium]